MVQGALSAYVHSHVGQTVHINDVMDAMPEGAQLDSVQRAFDALILKGYAIDKPVGGHVYTIKALPHSVNGSDRPLFEQIGTAKDGRVILQSEDGTIYIAQEVK